MKQINEQELKQLLKEKPNLTLINVLPEKVFEQGHIPNSINIPVENENFSEEVGSWVQNKQDPIVVYCASTQCSASTMAAEILEKNGYREVLDFKGGMEEWGAAGNKITTEVA
jgi:rhodanese-related sulfurtransferase